MNIMKKYAQLVINQPDCVTAKHINLNITIYN